MIKKGIFDNSIRLFRLIMRRERINTSIWLVILVIFSAVLAPGMNSMFSDTETRMQLAAINDNPVMLAMMGPLYGVDDFSAGALYAGMMLLWYGIAIAVMNIFLVARHTRADEERGRGEVVRSLPVGRLSTLNATMVAALVINTALGLLTGLGIAVTGVEGMGFASSMLYGVLAGAIGLVFAAITALFCQLSASSGGATGMSMAVMGFFYMLRAGADAQGSDFVACLSPFGLAQRAQVYVNDYLWPLFLLLLLAVILTAVAYGLNAIRDLGQGFIAARPGRGVAARRMCSAPGLALRLTRNQIIIWLVVMFSLAASYGSVYGDLGAFVGDSPEYLQAIGIPAEIVATMSDADKGKIIIDYFSVFNIVMMVLVVMVPVLVITKKPRSEEREGRAEHIVARVVSRHKYLAGYVGIAFVLSILLQFVTAVGLYSAVAAISDVPMFDFADLTASILVYLPAIWVMIGVAVFVTGALPKATGAVWGFYGFVAFMALVGRLFDLPTWIKGISPMYHIPQIPMEEFAWPPLVVLTVISVALTGLGFVFYGRRDTVAGV